MNKRAWKDWATLCRRDPCPSPRVQSGDLGQCVATCLVLVSLLCRCSSGLLLLWSWHKASRKQSSLSGKESAQGCIPKRLLGRPD